MPPHLDELIGPYERWAHGTGVGYTLRGSDIRTSPYVAAVVELPAGTDPKQIADARLQDGATSGDAATSASVLLPTLWEHAFDNQERVYCPLVLNVPPTSGCDGLDRLQDIASSLFAFQSLSFADQS